MEQTKEIEEFIDIAGISGSVRDAVFTRHSARDFEKRPIPENKLQELMKDALRSPSWKNSQPWQLHVVTGKTRDRLAAKLTAAAKAGTPAPDTVWPEAFPSDIRRRMFDLGMKIYGVAGIERKDKEARDAFMLRNFEFFGAPVALFITSRCDLNFYVGLDIGCFLNTVMLLAREKGLGTCPQAALSAFPAVVREELSLPEEEKVVCGMSIGYPIADSRLNTYHTPRETPESLIHFYS